MLPLSTCRSLLPKNIQPSEEELETIRLHLYQLAEVCIKSYLETEKQENQK